MSSLRSAGRSRRQTADGAPSRRRFLLFFLCAFLLTGSWALATPMWAAPDEPAHVFRAVSVVHGDLLPAATTTQKLGAFPVKVPADLVESAGKASCFEFHGEVPASCAAATQPDNRMVEAEDPAARYHPVYYALVGWPSLFLSNNSVVFGMRLVSAALVSLLIASGLQSAAEHPRSRLMLTGSFVALTPMVLFLGGTVQPSAVEIAGGFAVWAAGLTLLTATDPTHERVLLRRLAIAACLVVVSRTISPLWLALILVALLLLAGRQRLRELLRLPSLRLWGPVVGVATLASVAWTLIAKPNPMPVERPDPSSPASALRQVFQIMPWRLDQYIGRFGWLDTPSPTYTLVAFTVLIGFTILFGLAAGRRKEALVLGGVLATVVVLPVALEIVTFNTEGYYWQMRYAMPLAVGVPVLGLSLVTHSSGAALRGLLESRLSWLVVLLGVPAQLLSFVWALRRYQVGANVPLGVFQGSWAPRVGTWTVVALQLLGLVLWGLLTIRSRRPDHDEPPADTRSVPVDRELAFAAD